MRQPSVHLESRHVRVTLLSVAMILMGLADLQLTLTYMRSVGMIEANPIARLMVEIGGSRQLVIFKLFTIAASAGLLYLVRSHRLAERCAWASCCVMLALMMHWVRYNDRVTSPEFATAAVAHLSMDTSRGLGLEADPRWVLLRD